jgi:hypothetical protein
VATWNIVSFFGELSLLWIVYKLVPSLSVKKTRDSGVSMEKKEAEKDDDSIRVQQKLLMLTVSRTNSGIILSGHFSLTANKYIPRFTMSTA